MFRWLLQGLCGLALGCQALVAFADPPQYVGRVALAEGDVVLVPASGQDEITAPTNYPLVAGARLQTRGPGGAEIEFAGVRLWLAGDSELAVLQTEAAAEEVTADAQPALQLALGAGALVVRVDDPAPRIAPRLETAGALIELRSAGEYRLDSTGTTAAVVVRKGLLRIDAGGSLAYLTDGQRVELADGTLGVPAYAGAPAADDFDAWVAARQAPPPPRYVSSEMPGARDLASYGSWEQTADYGPVWAPYWVPAGWAPYRNGEWVWLPPWGWTWIDHAPWGFAPFHFGRWAHHHGRWCWVPGAGRPIFAPGLVQVIDGGKHIHPRHGKPQRWAPLTPHDKFVPTFPASGRFAERVNAGHGRWLGRGRTVAPSETSGEVTATAAANPAISVTSRGAEMKVSQWPGGRSWRDRGGGRPVPSSATSAGSAAPAVGVAPVFAPVLGPGRAASERAGRGWRRGDFVAPPVVAAPPSAPPVVAAPAAPIPSATPVLPARGEDRRSNWRERSQGAWPQAPASVTMRPAVTLPAVAAPQRSGRAFGPAAPAVTVNPPAATSSAVPTLRRFGDHGSGSDSGRGGGRAGGRRF